MGTHETPETKKMLSSSRGTLLKKERERRCWTQSSVAERIGTTQINVSRWENGLTVPSLYYRQKLAELFEKSSEELGLVGESQETPAQATPSASYRPDPLPSAPPLWFVPYRRNPFFTGRTHVLADLATLFEHCRPLSLPLAMSGLGGIGKTQIAIEYAHHHYGERYESVFWINATTYDTLTADFVTLGARLIVPEQHEQDQDAVVRAVKRWLITHDNWLLILDNVETLEIIVDFLPAHGKGDILLTTRLQASGTIAHCIEVENMAEDEGALLLLRRSKTLAPDAQRDKVKKEDWDNALQIVTALNGLPLALDQAGAYIEETRCGLAQYLNLYATHHKELLLRRGRSSVDHPDSVATTWSISFQKIEQEYPAAADLLYVLAFLDPEAIPEEIITRGADALGFLLKNRANDPLHMDATIELLLHYSLIRRSSEKNLLSIHHLVQTVLKDRLDRNTQHIWAERTLRAVTSSFPEVKPQTWERCQYFLSHVQKCVTYVEEYSLAFPEIVHLFNEAAFYLKERAWHKQAEFLLWKALALRQHTSIANHPYIARTYTILGTLYLDVGKYQDAKTYLFEALKLRKQVLGEVHPDVAQTLYYLASLYRMQGFYREAEPLYVQSLQIGKHTLPGEHPLIARSYYGLARLYLSQENYAPAEEWCIQALNIQKKIAENDPKTASTYNVLAKIYQRQMKIEQAKQMNKYALHIRRTISGKNHPQIAVILNSMAEIYHIEGKFQAARALIERSLKIFEEWFASEHPYMAYSFSNKAENCFLQKDYLQAESYYKKALCIREQQLGPEHPHTATTYCDLAKVYAAVGRYEEAEQFYTKALSIYEYTFGRTHALVARLQKQLKQE